MRYADLKENDIVDGKGICVSLWTQGCPHKCPGCHNPETWSFNGGIEIAPAALTQKVLKAINKNGVKRNFSVLGGEPLCPENREYIADLLLKVRCEYPNIDIYLWTGYTYEELKADKTFNYEDKIFSKINYLIDGRFIQSQRDLTLELRGSQNQRIIKFKD